MGGTAPTGRPSDVSWPWGGEGVERRCRRAPRPRPPVRPRRPVVCYGGVTHTMGKKTKKRPRWRKLSLGECDRPSVTCAGTGRPPVRLVHAATWNPSTPDHGSVL